MHENSLHLIDLNAGYFLSQIRHSKITRAARFQELLDFSYGPFYQSPCQGLYSSMFIVVGGHI